MHKTNKKTFLNIAKLLPIIFLFFTIVPCSHCEAIYQIFTKSVSYAVIDICNPALVLVKIPVYIDDTTGLEAWNLNITYDPDVLALVGLDSTQLTDFYTIVHNLEYEYEENLARINLAGMIAFSTDSGHPTGGGALFNILFHINTLSWAATPINLEVYDDPDNQLRVSGTGVFFAENVHYELSLPEYLDISLGQDAYVDIYINDTQGLTYWNLVLTYDSHYLEFKGIERTHLTDNYMGLFANETSPGYIEVAGMNADPVRGSGALFRAIFRAKAEGRSIRALSVQCPLDMVGIDNQLSTIAPAHCSLRVSSEPVRDEAIPGYIYSPFSQYGFLFKLYYLIGAYQPPFSSVCLFIPCPVSLYHIPAFGTSL